MSLSVRYAYDDRLLVSNGTEIWVSDLGHFAAPLDAVRDLSLARLRRSLATHASVWARPEVAFFVSDVPAQAFNDETSSMLAWGLYWDQGELLVTAQVADYEEFD